MITIQKTVKMYLSKKKHRPRYQMTLKIRTLSSQLQQIAAMAKNLKSDKESVEKATRKIQENINDVLKKIKTNENIRAKDMEKYYQGLVDQINKEISNVKSKVFYVLKLIILQTKFSRLRNRRLQKNKRS